MLQIHPDIHVSVRKDYSFDVQEINAAYAVLKKYGPVNEKAAAHPHSGSAETKHRSMIWDAPINENAYMEREILHTVKSPAGDVLGNFCIAKGKYMWQTEEDFSLFLLSMYQCSNLLLDEIDSKCGHSLPSAKRQHFQAELSYLLTQQFINGSILLRELAKEEKTAADGSRTFYITSMLETPSRICRLQPGETLYPAGLRRHRLYLKNHAGHELGYLSFPDDRLYYVIVPLFEQKRVQIRIQTASRQAQMPSRSAARYQNLDLWLRLPHTAASAMPENLNLQIRQLLEQYQQSG